MRPLMEESSDSIFGVSDVTFEESREDVLGESRLRPGYGQPARR
jgi:hypothetical protein